MWGCGGDSAVQPHSMDGVRGGEEGHTQEHTQERTRECCTYPLATYPLKSARVEGGDSPYFTSPDGHGGA